MLNSTLITIYITNQDINKISPEIKVINGYQCGKFLKDYTNIYPENHFDILLTGGDPALFPEELTHIINCKQRNCSIILMPKLLFKADLTTIRTLERADLLLIPFANKYKENWQMQNFLSNVDKFTQKDKVVPLIDTKEFQNIKKLLGFLQVIKRKGFNKFMLDNLLTFDSNIINKACKVYQLQQITFDFNESFHIELDGTVKSPSKQSSIFKAVGHFIL